MRKSRNPASEIPLPGLQPFIAEFSASRKEELVQLKGYLDASDFEAMRKLAHTWKGFAVPYGYGILEYLAIELELAAEDRNREVCQSLVKEVEIYLSSK